MSGGVTDLEEPLRAGGDSTTFGVDMQGENLSSKSAQVSVDTLKIGTYLTADIP